MGWDLSGNLAVVRNRPTWMPQNAKNGWDPRRSAYNLKASTTRRLRAGHAKAVRGQRVHEVVIGDSLSAGWINATGTYDRPNCWPQVYKNSIDVPNGGTGWLRVCDNNTADARMVQAGSWSGNVTSSYSTAAGSTITFTADSSGSSFAVLYQLGSGAFTISVDGATSGYGYLAVQGATGTGPAIASLPASIRPGSKIVVTSVTANVTQYQALAVLNASGIVVNNVAQGGSSAAGTGLSSWSDGAGTPSANNQNINMYGPGAYESTPTCVHIMLLTNDVQIPVTPAQFTAAVTTIRNQFPNSDCVLHLQPQPGAISVATWTPYASALYTLADTLDVPLIDHWDALGGYDAENSNGLTGDTFAHLNSAGYAQMGRVTAAALSGAGDTVDYVTTPVLATAYKGNTAPSGQVQMPSTILSLAAGAPPSGQASFYPIDVGPGQMTIKALVCSVTTAQSGGTGTLVKGAIYADNGTGGAPLLTAAGLLAQVTFTATATGNKTQALTSGTFDLPPGRYWVCGFYYQGSTAPTTAPQVTCATNATALWTLPSVFGTVIRYLTVTGLTDLPIAGQTIGVSGSGTGMVVGLQAA